MAYIQLPKEEIRISIPNLVQNNTIIVREAFMISMVYDSGVQQVTINWGVQHFDYDENSTYIIDGVETKKGNSLEYIIPSYVRPTIAHNGTMCDISNGYPIEARVDTSIDSTSIEPPVADYSWFEGNYTGQYDFFAYIAEMQPIMVNQMIKNFGIMVSNWNKR